jgi:Ca-activated chloride channel family protein
MFKYNPRSTIRTIVKKETLNGEPGTWNLKERKEHNMKPNRMKSFFLIVLLIAVTAAAMAYSSGRARTLLSSWTISMPGPGPLQPGIVRIWGNLVQNKILQGSDGTVNLSLAIQADEVLEQSAAPDRHVDMVIVLDRSGSMQGKKITDARQAALSLLSRLGRHDRIALITYSDKAHQSSGLLNVSDLNRKYLESIISGIHAGGGTNLGAGLKQGINTLVSTPGIGNTGKLILISDGLANKGITHPQELGNLAGIAVEKEFTVSTVGVGAEFNEYLMTTIADRGTGNYYYLENPGAFADVFQKEFNYSRATVASRVSVQVALKDGISLVNAAGYPISIKSGAAVFHPGDLRSGQTRKLFLTLRVPSHAIREFEINDIRVNYMHDGKAYEAILEKIFTVACVKDRQEVYSSIDKTGWTQKVLQEDFNKLKQEIAHDIKTGKKESALRRISKYHKEQEEINTVVDSREVDNNLKKDLEQLRSVVEDSFQGAPAAAQEKQKLNSKSLQYEGYSGRRQH